MKSNTNYFTINQFFTLQNFTWGGGWKNPIAPYI